LYIYKEYMSYNAKCKWHDYILPSLFILSLFLSFFKKTVPSIYFFIYNSHEKIRWLFCNTFLFFRVLRLLKESVLTSTLNVLPRLVKVFVRYLNMQQELHWWFQRRRSPRVALFCKKKIKKLKKWAFLLWSHNKYNSFFSFFFLFFITFTLFTFIYLFFSPFIGLRSLSTFLSFSTIKHTYTHEAHTSNTHLTSHSLFQQNNINIISFFFFLFDQITHISLFSKFRLIN
jgi:hypothetical protein